MNRGLSGGARLLVTAIVFAILVWRLGTGPLVDGIRTIDGTALAAASGLAVLTTICCAWRWKIVARALGADLPLSVAIAAYYRSLFLNVTLPGGIVGDVHRGISHGRELGDVGRAVRGVAWERLAGQAVQAVLTVAVLLALPSPVRSPMPLVAVGVAVVVAGTVGVARMRLRLGWRSWVAVVLASALVVCGHAATFVIAARTAGSTAPLSTLLPLALLVMLAMVLPSFAGWGPREGAAAWVFGAAGLGVGQGVATAVVYGVMVFAASLPGAAVLVVSSSHRLRPGSAHA
jgi:uncharacterized membrane protein YbhN (UPF0104 family)